MFEGVIWGIYLCAFIGIICVACAITDRAEAKKNVKK